MSKLSCFTLLLTSFFVINQVQPTCGQLFYSQILPLNLQNLGLTSVQQASSHEAPVNTTNPANVSSTPQRASSDLIKTTGKHSLCTSLLSPCVCNNTKCCGALSGGAFVNCAHLFGLGVFKAVAVPSNPCSKTQCTQGTCMIVSVLSSHGVKEWEERKCCKGSSFSQVSCGEGINCQQRNKNGSVTTCCDPACAGAL